MSADKPKRTIFRAPGQQLRRGKACLNCRHLKIKCDGVKPVCGPCTRVPKDDECEYTDGPSRTQELLDKISGLQDRIRELEGQASDLQIETSRSSPSPFSSYSGSPASSSSFHLSEEGSLCDSLEPPAAIVNILLDAFLPHASMFGFFLNADHFRQSALLPAPFGDQSRPTAALLYAVYLWGAQLSSSYQAHVSIFLGRALRQLAMEVSSRVNLTQMINTIQAQVLLAMYFFRNNHLVETAFHTTGAVSLACSYNLHKIRSTRTLDLATLGDDGLSEAERINAFWTVFCLDRTVRVCLGHETTSFGFLENPSEEIDTPWPIEMDAYSPTASPISLNSSTIRNFISRFQSGQGFAPSSPTVWYTQSIILFYRASLLYSRFLRGVRADETHMLIAGCNTHKELLATFQLSLPPLSSLDPDPYSPTTSSLLRRTLLIAHSLMAASLMKVHAIYAAYGDTESTSRCVASAQWILEAYGDVTLPDFTILHPIVGVLCLTACQILIGEIQRTGQPSDPMQLAEQVRLRSVLLNGTTTMGILAVDCPLIASQVEQVQIVFNGL